MDSDPVKKRMLVADDYPDVAELLAELIGLTVTFPLEIAIVRNGAEALAKVIADRPDCAILDVDMPVLDGMAAAIAIRSRLGVEAPVLIALTGDPRHAERPGCRAAFDHFFEKPANVDQLIALVARSPLRRRIRPGGPR